MVKSKTGLSAACKKDFTYKYKNNKYILQYNNLQCAGYDLVKETSAVC